jgi:hypothetical protein
MRPARAWAQTQSVRMPKRSATSSAVSSRSMLRSSRTCSLGSRYGMALRSPRPGRVAGIGFDRQCERPGARRGAPPPRRRGVKYPLSSHPVLRRWDSRRVLGIEPFGRRGRGTNYPRRQQYRRLSHAGRLALTSRGGDRCRAVPRVHARCVTRGDAPGHRGHARPPGAALRLQLTPTLTYFERLARRLYRRH